MRGDDLAPLINFAARFGPGGNPASGQGDIGFHMGIVHAWDAITGENTIGVAGGTVTNVSVLSTADNIMLNPGDTVGLLRFKSTYFILGRIAPPGGGAAMGIREAYTETEVNTGSSTWIDLGGPELTDVYIGSSRRCLVFLLSQIAVGNCWGEAGVAVSGASDINPGFQAGAPAQLGAFDVVDVGSNGRVYGSGTATSILMLDQSHGLRSGLNSFRMMYRRNLSTGYTPLDNARFARRRVVVFPF